MRRCIVWRGTSAAHSAPGDEVAVYSLPKSKAFPGKPGVRLQETSHPSLLLYLDCDVLETKDWSKVLAETKPTWIITRWNRIGPAELASAAGRLREIPVTGEELYRLYRLEPPLQRRDSSRSGRKRDESRRYIRPLRNR